MHSRTSRSASGCPSWCISEHGHPPSGQHESISVSVPVVLATTVFRQHGDHAASDSSAGAPSTSEPAPSLNETTPQVELRAIVTRVGLVTEAGHTAPFIVLADESTERFLELTLGSATALATLITVLADSV